MHWKIWNHFHSINYFFTARDNLKNNLVLQYPKFLKCFFQWRCILFSISMAVNVYFVNSFKVLLCRLFTCLFVWIRSILTAHLYTNLTWLIWNHSLNAYFSKISINYCELPVWLQLIKWKMWKSVLYSL